MIQLTQTQRQIIIRSEEDPIVSYISPHTGKTSYAWQAAGVANVHLTASLTALQAKHPEVMKSAGVVTQFTVGSIEVSARIVRFKPGVLS